MYFCKIILVSLRYKQVRRGCRGWFNAAETGTEAVGRPHLDPFLLNG